MKRFRVVLRDGKSTTIRGHSLGFASDRHPRDYPYASNSLPYVRDVDGEIVFVGSFREVAYVADVEAEDLFDGPARKSDEAKSGIARWLDLVSKGVAVLSGLAVVLFVVLIATGHGSVGVIQAESALTVFAFTLIGGIVSVGGVQLFSVTASLRRASERVETIERRVGGNDNDSVRVLRTFGIDFTTDDDDLLSALQDARHSNTVLDDSLAILVGSAEFRAKVADEARWRRREGWTLAAISPNDSIHNGLIVNLLFEKALES